MSRLNALLGVLTLRCEAASELSSRELDDSLSRPDRAALLCHILVCSSCRRFRSQIRSIRIAIRLHAQFVAETDCPEGRLSAEGRYRIALACRSVGSIDPGVETMLE